MQNSPDDSDFPYQCYMVTPLIQRGVTPGRLLGRVEHPTEEENFAGGFILDEEQEWAINLLTLRNVTCPPAAGAAQAESSASISIKWAKAYRVFISASTA